MSEGDPAAVSTAYLHDPAAPDDDADVDPDVDADVDADVEPDQEFSSFESVLTTLPATAVSMEMCPPQPAIARSLRLSPGQSVITVTVRFDDAATGEPTGLTVVILKPELFRVTIDTTEAPVGAPLIGLAAGKR
jgi:hypothetical protein